MAALTHTLPCGKQTGGGKPLPYREGSSGLRDKGVGMGAAKGGRLQMEWRSSSSKKNSN